MTAPAIRTEELTRDFPGVRAVSDLSLEVPRGTIFGFLGPNGSGKTTTIRLLLGLLEPSAGAAEVLGFDTHRQAPAIRERCGALLEYSGLYERLSAEDNLEYFARIWRLPDAERRARIKELLSHVDLWDRRSERTGTWSRGMKRVSDARLTLELQPDAPSAPLVRLLVEGGAEVEEVRRGQASLEEAFLTLVESQP